MRSIKPDLMEYVAGKLQPWSSAFLNRLLQQICCLCVANLPHLVAHHVCCAAAEAQFLCACYSTGGSRHAPYTPICASGPNGERHLKSLRRPFLQRSSHSEQAWLSFLQAPSSIMGMQGIQMVSCPHSLLACLMVHNLALVLKSYDAADRQIQQGDILLFDMGCEYYGWVI